MVFVIIMIFFIPLFLAINFRIERKKIINKIKNNKNDKKPNVSVIVPFIGNDYNFLNTVDALLNQDYKGKYDILFVTSDRKSYNAQIIEENFISNKKIKLIYAQMDSQYKNRGDKINNMLQGVRNCEKDTDIFIFMDSDMKPREDWINNMVNTALIDDCGLATGSDWIIAKDSGIWDQATRF